jgi:hypothetical protein
MENVTMRDVVEQAELLVDAVHELHGLAEDLPELVVRRIKTPLDPVLEKLREAMLHLVLALELTLELRGEEAQVE